MTSLTPWPTVANATRSALAFSLAPRPASPMQTCAMLPLFQFPNIAAWRTDKLDGPIDKDAANYQAFQNIWEWQPKSGTQINIGAEQWPDCMNPITECANSSWYVWTTAFKVLPNVWDSTSEGTYEATDLVSAEPTVQVL